MTYNSGRGRGGGNNLLGGLLGGVLGGRGGRGGSRVVKLVIAVGIALFALVSYYFASDKNEFTDEKQRVSMSEAQEVKMGYAAVPDMVEQMGGAAPQNDPEQQVVTRVGQRLLEQGGINAVLREKKIPYEFTFTLLDDSKTVNAFALPGGPVFITRALYDDLQNEAQLAGVLGHEVGHVVERHGAQQMAKGQLGQQLTAAVAVGASDDRGRGQMAAAAAAMANKMIQLSYGRKDETQSDEHGLDFMVKAGYDPQEMVNVMQILKKAGGGGGSTPEFMQSHPLPESRIEDIQRWVKDKFPDGVPGDLSKGKALH